MFAELAVVWTECGEEMGVNIEFAHDFAVSEDRDDDLGFGFERTSKVARIGVDVVDDDGLAAGRRRATNALIERDAGVGRHGALERAEDENVAVALLFEHIKTNPIVTSELGVEEGDNALHQRVSRAGGCGESVELENQISGF